MILGLSRNKRSNHPDIGIPWGPLVPIPSWRIGNQPGRTQRGPGHWAGGSHPRFELETHRGPLRFWMLGPNFSGKSGLGETGLDLDPLGISQS
jgi:hypothetical protein